MRAPNSKTLYVSSLSNFLTSFRNWSASVESHAVIDHLVGTSFLLFLVPIAPTENAFCIAENGTSLLWRFTTASVAFNRNFGERASAAISGQYINYGSMKQVDENNIVSGTFSAKDISVAGYFSYLLGHNIAGGIAAKLITSYIGDYNSLALGVDLGLNYYNPDQEWSVSITAKNLGGQLKAYNEEFERMPIDVQIGTTKRLINAPFRISATLVDLNHWNYKFIKHAVVGMDILLSEDIWVGLGYNFRRANDMKIQSGEEESSHGAGLSLGAGLYLNRFKLNLAYGKYHISSHSMIINAAYSL